MKTSYDVCIIGGGILGCMVARELSRYQVRTVLLEQREDVCMGITKANSAIIYAGYDHKPRTQKGSMCVRGNARMEYLCEELDVLFERKGSIMLGFGPKGEHVLRKKLEQGKCKQVPGIELISGQEVCALEPYVNPAVTMGLYAETTATVNPWELGIAAFENAVENGLDAFFCKKVTHIRKSGGASGYEIEVMDTKTGKTGSILAGGILNCGGVHADEIRNLILPPRYVIKPTRAGFLIFSKHLQSQIRHVLFCEPEDDRKGVTFVPTTDGSLLAGGTLENARSRSDTATEQAGLEALAAEVKYLIPQIDFAELIHSFAGVRPNPWEIGTEKKSIPGFVIDADPQCPGLISMIGIKTPGLTCSQELAEYAIRLLFEGLGQIPEKKAGFKAARISYMKRDVSLKRGKILCHCNQVTEEELQKVIERLKQDCGIVTWEGIRHRCFAGMGRCQGSRCRSKIMNLAGSSDHNMPDHAEEFPLADPDIPER